MGLFDKIRQRWADKKQRAEDVQEFQRELLAAASDGKLSDDEISQIQQSYRELGLTDEDMKVVRIEAYTAAVRAVRADGVVTEDELGELQKLQTFLKIPDSAVAGTKADLLKLRLIAEIESGNCPSVSVQNLILRKGEKAFWVEEAELLEEKVVARRYEGGSRGVSVRIAKGLTYRVGAHRGQMVSESKVLPTSRGELVVTSARVVFKGDRKSFNIPYEKLLHIEFYSDGIQVTDDKGKPRTLRFVSAGNVEVVGAVLNHAINSA